MLTCIISALFIFHDLSGQVKNEKEYRVLKKDVPTKAINSLNNIFDHSQKVKWYYQSDSEKSNYEAKFEWKDNKYSVEFALDGSIDNIELEISWEKLQNKLKTKIEHYLGSNYSYYKILKIQQQFIGSCSDLEDLIKENEFEDIAINYELEFYGKIHNEYSLWESFINSNGDFLQTRKVITATTQNLEF